MDPAERFIDVVRSDGRFPLSAYEFLHRGIEYTVRRVYGDAPSDEPRHVSGRELSEGLRELALESWGYLAPSVLAAWRIHRTRDFGEMVYLLVKHGFYSAQPTDRVEHFDDIYDFRIAFGYKVRVPAPAVGDPEELRSDE